MKPAAFAYAAPASVGDALSLLAQHGDNAKVLAGGQSLVPVLNFRLSRYDILIDINRIDRLSFITLEDARLRIGAMTRQREIETSPVVARHAPLLAEATRSIAHLPIRTRGTIGGSLAHADPAAEYPAVVLALDAELVLERASRSRRVLARDFFLGPLETVLEPDELLVEIAIPAKQADEGFAFEEVSRRRGDFAILGMAAAIACEQSRITRARIAICGLESSPVRVEDAERFLAGKLASSDVLDEAARIASAAVTAQSDLHATAQYRTHLVEMLLPQVVGRAVAAAAGGIS